METETNMKIEKIDKNFDLRQITEGEKIRYEIPHAVFGLYGIFYDKTESCFMRMPSKVAEKVSDGVTREKSGNQVWCQERKIYPLKSFYLIYKIRFVCYNKYIPKNRG